ncbi:TetR family transcriptional regulator [Gordonia amarae]|nr:TetR family transcriptional regulator [Gordonia amarae]
MPRCPRCVHSATESEPMTRMPVEDRRKALVEAAFEVIAEHGVENATTRSICSHAGMPLASFHYAFESRDDLLRRVMLTILPVAIDDWVASMLPRADSPLHGRAGLEKNLRKHLGMLRMVLESGPGRMRACVSLALYAHNHPPVAAAAKEMFESLYTIADQGARPGCPQHGCPLAASDRYPRPAHRGYDHRRHPGLPGHRRHGSRRQHRRRRDRDADESCGRQLTARPHGGGPTPTDTGRASMPPCAPTAVTPPSQCST